MINFLNKKKLYIYIIPGATCIVFPFPFKFIACSGFIPPPLYLGLFGGMFCQIL